MSAGENARVACYPSSYKAFDKAAIGISIEQVERAERRGGEVASLEIGFEPSRGRKANRDPQDMRSGEEGRILTVFVRRFGTSVCLYARIRAWVSWYIGDKM